MIYQYEFLIKVETAGPEFFKLTTQQLSNYRKNSGQQFVFFSQVSQFSRIICWRLRDFLYLCTRFLG